MIDRFSFFLFKEVFARLSQTQSGTKRKSQKGVGRENQRGEKAPTRDR
jgi:hypothetical protein